MQNDNYYACLVRMRREHADAPWRILLQAVNDDEQRHFGSIAELYAFLNEKTSARSSDPARNLPQNSPQNLPRNT